MRFSGTCATLLVTLLLLSGCFSGRSVVVLLPDDEGNVGEIRVQSGERSVVIDQAYRSITTGSFFSSQSPKVVEKSEIDTTFKAAIANEPRQRFRFLKRTFYFHHNSCEFTASSKAMIPEAIQLLQQEQPLAIYVVGHADRVGTEQYNRKISAMRAETVREALIGGGVEGKIITISHLGESMPLVETADEVMEPKNRRAELVLKYPRSQ